MGLADWLKEKGAGLKKSLDEQNAEVEKFYAERNAEMADFAKRDLGLNDEQAKDFANVGSQLGQQTMGSVKKLPKFGKVFTPDMKLPNKEGIQVRKQIQEFLRENMPIDEATSKQLKPVGQGKAFIREAIQPNMDDVLKNAPDANTEKGQVIQQLKSLIETDPNFDLSKIPRDEYSKLMELLTGKKP